MVETGTISHDDMNLLLITDDIDDAVAHIQNYKTKQKSNDDKSKPIWILGEKKV